MPSLCRAYILLYESCTHYVQICNGIFHISKKTNNLMPFFTLFNTALLVMKEQRQHQLLKVASGSSSSFKRKNLFFYIVFPMVLLEHISQERSKKTTTLKNSKLQLFISFTRFMLWFSFPQ